MKFNLKSHYKPKQLFLILFLILAQSIFPQVLSKNCIDELLAVPENSQHFDLQDFLTKDLPSEVIKVKARLKLPFGKPKDDKVTDIGVTVGCLKEFPENLDQIQSMLKKVSLEMAKRTVTSKSGTNASRAGGSSSENPIANFDIRSFASNSATAANTKSALKKCDAIFNPKKKFCYDGVVYNLCDGKPYNPLMQKCENNMIIATCGTTEYNTKTHGCRNDIVYPRCGTNKLYDPVTQGCKDDVVLLKCGTVELYDPVTQGCKDDVVLSKCGTSELYDPKINLCKDNTVFSLSKCGTIFYNPEIHGCENNIVLTKCDATLYNPETHVCEGNIVYTIQKCGSALYNPATHACEDNIILTKCGTNKLYNSETHGCAYNALFELPKCGATVYNPATHNCKDNIVVP